MIDNTSAQFEYNMETFRILLYSIFLLSTLFPKHSFGQDTTPTVNKLWEGIGGKSKWDETHFILFSAAGNNTSTFIENPRKFLINRQNGDCRFEGATSSGDEITLLFNYRTNKIRKLYVNEVEQTNLDNFSAKNFPLITRQFKQDVSLLFLPTVLGSKQFKTGDAQQKIVDAEKLTVVTVNSTTDLNVKLNGKLFFNSESGKIRRWELSAEDDSVQYLIDNFKDIGDGLILPTTFKSLNDNSKSVIFSTVAAFVDMELSKFTTL
ncbi:hypothetical protein [Sphingobacterium spiritivorum]|uniref:hypothetical protein n=2 Tax=Sphingobacterium spiritivorum TaxID=258 RepID=UPI003DA42DE3